MFFLNRVCLSVLAFFVCHTVSFAQEFISESSQECVYEDSFLQTKEEYSAYMDRKDVILIASPGRSGSTLLVDVMKKQFVDRFILKTHQSVPSYFSGKIIFIFSNPDLAAESLLHWTLESSEWGIAHFYNVFSSDKKWLDGLGLDFSQQTLECNLLMYDALGYERHITEWLFIFTESSTCSEAQILAIKYENLWDEKTQNAIKQFCSVPNLILPEKKQRGYGNEQLSELEALIRNFYNEGTLENPQYKTYDDSRKIWQEAPPFQFLKIK